MAEPSDATPEIPDHEPGETPVSDSAMTAAAPSLDDRPEGGADDMASTLTADQITRLAFWLELALVVVAVAIATWLNFYDRERPLSLWFTGHWFGSLLIGCLAAVPLLWLVTVVLPAIPALGALLESIEKVVAPIFAGIRIWQIAVISVAAGVGEEIFFRWFLQGGLAQWMPPAAAVAVASVVFGVCHWLNTTYLVLTTLMGVILGLIYIYAGPLAAVACHAAYDFLAIRYLAAKNG